MGRRLLILGLAAGLLLGLAHCTWFRPPSLTLSVVPQASAVHTLVTIVGQGFGTTQGTSVVSFDGLAASVVSWTDTQIVARVPVLATPAGGRLATVRVHVGGVEIGTGLFTVLRGVLFETGRDGNNEIYVMNPDGTQPMNLTNHTASDTYAAWSPDGTKIAFVTGRTGNSEIYVMNADGSNPRNLTQHPDRDYFPVWSPDGTKLAFMTDREDENGLMAEPKILIIAYNVEIFVMNADGSGQTNITNHPAWDGYPSWSPSGDAIVFESERDAQQGGAIVFESERDAQQMVMGLVIDLGDEIYVVGSDGSDPTGISNNPESDAYPSWSPDGSKILFQSTRDGNWEIYTMNPDGTGQTRLTTDPAADTYATWSPTGSWITFHSQRGGGSDIYKIRADGSSETRLTADPDWDWGPSWSHDSTKITFQTSRDGNSEIYVMNADGSSQIRLTIDPAWDFHPVWTTAPWLPPA